MVSYRAITAANLNFNRAWQDRSKIAKGGGGSSSVLKRVPEHLARTLENLNFIDSERDLERIGLKGLMDISGIAGAYSRKERVIYVRSGQSDSIARFTLAHELGHHFLHSQSLSFRDNPVDESRLGSASRPLEEREADQFAANLLMPSAIFIQEFANRFGGPFDISDSSPRTQELLFQFRRDGGAEMSLFNLARFVAQLGYFSGQSFEPLSSFFGVSTTASGIHVRDLGLVF
jgi:Zn-dependent peptidase ImmA (M78 family)